MNQRVQTATERLMTLEAREVELRAKLERLNREVSAASAELSDLQLDHLPAARNDVLAEVRCAHGR